MESVAKSLQGRLILVIESDAALAQFVEDGIRAAGGVVLGPARTLKEAAELSARLRERPDAAVVNPVVEGGSAIVVIDRLVAAGLRIVIVSTQPAEVPAHLVGWPRYRPPFAGYQIVGGLCDVLRDHPITRSGRSDGPHIRGH